MMMAATIGVNVMILSTGKFIIHLLEQHDHGFVDHIEDPCRVDADPQDQCHQWDHDKDFARVDLGQLMFTVCPMFVHGTMQDLLYSFQDVSAREEQAKHRNDCIGGQDRI